MINRQITILYRGYDPINLKSKSCKQVYVNCNQCGIGRWIRFDAYSNLCHKCASSGSNNGMYDIHKFGKNNPFYGKKHSEKSQIKMREKRKYRIGKLAPFWRGGISFLDQPHLTSINQCIQLNERFKGSHGHHITSGVVIFIPKNIHKSISHNMKTGKNIKEINKLALNYLVGDI